MPRTAQTAPAENLFRPSWKRELNFAVCVGQRAEPDGHEGRVQLGCYQVLAQGGPQIGPLAPGAAHAASIVTLPGTRHDARKVVIAEF